MKAYLIDAKAEVPITEVEWSGKFKGPNGGYELLGVEIIEVIRNVSPQGDEVFIDEEGTFKEQTHGFYIDGYPSVLVGKGLVTGHPGDDGEARPVECSLEYIRSRIRPTTVHKREEAK